MKLFVFFLGCTQVLCSKAISSPSLEGSLVSIPCNDPGAETAADLSLRQLNAHRREGFVLRLNRISNVQEQFGEETGIVYYLTLDVSETECHVLSKRVWEDCEPKPLNEAVFGQCKVIFHINKPRRTAHLYNYDCTLRPAARGDIQMPCLGCPISRPFNDTRYQDVVKQSLEKFNRESNYSKHFSLGNITRASEQLIKGSSYFVEFTVQESSCNKSTLIEELSQCQPLDCEFAHYGYCKGSVRPHVNSLDKKNVTVSCEIFEPEAAVVEEQKHLDGRAHDKHDQSDRKNHSRKKGDKRGNKHGQSHHKHGHKHDQKHDHSHDHDHSGSHEHEHEHLHLHEHHHYPSLGTHGPSNSDRTVGIIRLLPHGEEPTTAPKKKKGKKPSDGTKPMPLPSFPDRPVAQNPNGESPVPLPFFPIGSEARPGQGHPAFHGRSSGPVILPFPEKVSTSDQCPGQPKRKVPSADVLPQPTLQPK